MPRVIVELHYQRVPAEPFTGKPVKPSTIYDGELVLRGEPGTSPSQNMTLPFSRLELQQVAVWLHHLVRLLAESHTEFCVRLFQKAWKSPRTAIAMDLDPAQVNLIYESAESAQLYFAPRIRTRRGGPSHVVKGEEDASENK